MKVQVTGKNYSGICNKVISAMQKTCLSIFPLQMLQKWKKVPARQQCIKKPPSILITRIKSFTFTGSILQYISPSLNITEISWSTSNLQQGQASGHSAHTHSVHSDKSNHAYEVMLWYVQWVLRSKVKQMRVLQLRAAGNRYWIF